MALVNSRVAIILSASLLAACGGGSGGSEPETVDPAENPSETVDPTPGTNEISFTPEQTGSNPPGLPQSVGDWVLEASFCSDTDELCRAGPIFASDENGVLALYREGADSDYTAVAIAGSPPTRFPGLGVNVSRYRPNEFLAITFDSEPYDLLEGRTLSSPEVFFKNDITVGGALVGGDTSTGAIFSNGSIITFDSVVDVDNQPTDPNIGTTWWCGFAAGNQNFSVIVSGPAGDEELVYQLDINSEAIDTASVLARFTNTSSYSCGNTIYGRLTTFSGREEGDIFDLYEIADGVVRRVGFDRFKTGRISFLGHLAVEEFLGTDTPDKITVIMGGLTVDAPPFSAEIASLSNRLYVMTDNATTGIVEVWSAPVSF